MAADHIAMRYTRQRGGVPGSHQLPEEMMRRILIRLTRLIAEETWLFASLIKWTLLATAVGVLAGCATALFLSLLGWSTGFMERTSLRLLWIPLGFLGAHLLVKWLAPDAEGHGTDKVIEV